LLTAPFQTELLDNPNGAASEIRDDVTKIRDEIGGQGRSVSAVHIHFVDRENADRCLDLNRVESFDFQRTLRLMFGPCLFGELPPPRKACFGRDELVRGIVDLAGKLDSIASIGAGGVRQTTRI
jgi:hypothetical protein